MTSNRPWGNTANSNTGEVRGAVVQAGSVDGIVVVNGPRSREFVSVGFSGAPDLFGRERELALLAEAFADRPSKPVVRVLTGEPGIGKSALGRLSRPYPAGPLRVDAVAGRPRAGQVGRAVPQSGERAGAW